MPAAGLSTRQNHCCHRSRHTDADSLHRGFYHPHSINYRISGAYGSAARVDIQFDRLVADRVEIKKGGYDGVGHLGIDFAPDEEDSAFQQKVLRFTFSFDISLPVLFDNAKVTKLTAIFRQ